jgi:pimeloyl-ACP methyl ester carboxylesterase
LITHGNAGCAIDRGYLAGPIHDAAPVDVYVLEYPGYGSRAGSPDKKSFLAAGDEAFGLLTNGLPQYLVSESIGAGVACYLAGAHPAEVTGFVLFMPYHNLASVAQRQMPLVPAYFLLLDRFNPAEYLRNYRGPVKIVLAGADEIIPVESGRRLFEGYVGPKNLQIIPGAHHNDIAGQSPAWWKEVFSFWQQNRPAKSGPSN